MQIENRPQATQATHHIYCSTYKPQSGTPAATQKRAIRHVEHLVLCCCCHIGCHEFERAILCSIMKHGICQHAVNSAHSGNHLSIELTSCSEPGRRGMDRAGR